MTPCEFFAPLLEYERDIFLSNETKGQAKDANQTKNQARDASDKLELFNLVHSKNTTKRLKIFANRTFATYELDGKNYQSTTKRIEPQCDCMKEEVKKLGTMTKFAKTMILNTCSAEKCIQNYYKKNIQSTKNETINRLSALLSQFSISPDVFVPLDQSRLDQKADHSFEDLDKNWEREYNAHFGEVKTTQEEFEQDIHARLLNSLECELGQVIEVAEELHLDSNKTMREVAGLED